MAVLAEARPDRTVGRLKALIALLAALLAAAAPLRPLLGRAVAAPAPASSGFFLTVAALSAGDHDHAALKPDLPRMQAAKPYAPFARTGEKKLPTASRHARRRGQRTGGE